MSSPNPTAAAPTPPAAAPRARIQPLGEQVIIRTIPVGSIGSILIPDTAKSITMMGDGNKPVPTEYLISASLLDDLMAAIHPAPGRRINFTELLMRAEKARKTPVSNNLSDAVHFVEAEVIAVGPGKRQKGDPGLLDSMAEALRNVTSGAATSFNPGFVEYAQSLIARAARRDLRIETLVQPGDRILYHPAVQRFDRDITNLMSEGNEGQGVKYFMIREESILAVIERD